MTFRRRQFSYLFFWAVLFFLLHNSSCKKSNPVQPQDPYPERANYTLILESGSNLDSIFVLTVDAKGKNMTTIPSPNKYSTWPLASPNGQIIAFRPGTDFMSLYSYSFSTKQSTPLLSDRNWDEYAWAPTSDRIVYSGDKTGGGFVIKTLNVTSGGTTLITDTVAGSERYPHWLSDGNTLAYAHYDSVNTTRVLYSFRFTSNQIQLIVDGQREASWSPDGQRFFANEKVYSWPSPSLIRDLSTLSSGSELFARWFPNGRDILVQTGTPDDGLYRVDVVSGAFEKIVTGAITFKAVSISVDGKLIAVIPGGSDNGRFIVADSLGRNQQSITLPIPGANYRRIQFVGDVVW